MKKLIFFILVFLVCTVTFLSLSRLSKPAPLNSTLINSSTELIKPVATGTREVGIPIRLSIPAVNIEAEVEPVGLDKKGAMDVPKNVNGLGWYNLGSKPGDLGSAVIDGHLDKVTGEPAVFYNLDKLKVNDEILVSDDKQIQYKFKVTDLQVYPYDKLPLTDIFTKADKARLNLITCGGNWEATKKNYSNRLVVYSELVE